MGQPREAELGLDYMRPPGASRSPQPGVLRCTCQGPRWVGTGSGLHHRPWHQLGKAASSRNTAGLGVQDGRAPAAPGSGSKTSLRSEYPSSAHVLSTKVGPGHTRRQASRVRAPSVGRDVHKDGQQDHPVLGARAVCPHGGCTARGQQIPGGAHALSSFPLVIRCHQRALGHAE